MTGLSEATGEGGEGWDGGREEEGEVAETEMQQNKGGDELKQTGSFVEVSARVEKKKDREGRRTGEQFFIESERLGFGSQSWRAGGGGADRDIVDSATVSSPVVCARWCSLIIHCMRWMSLSLRTAAAPFCSLPRCTWGRRLGPG